MSFRVSKDGTLLAPRRGQAPPCPDGFKSTGDPFICLPLIPKCQYRFLIAPLGCCGSEITKLGCKIVNLQVTKGVCKNCGADKEWVLDYRKKFGSQVKALA